MLKKMFAYFEMVSVGATAAFIYGAVDKQSVLMVAGAAISIVYGVVFIIVQQMLVDRMKSKKGGKK